MVCMCSYTRVRMLCIYQQKHDIFSRVALQCGRHADLHDARVLRVDALLHQIVVHGVRIRRELVDALGRGVDEQEQAGVGRRRAK